MLPSRVKWSFKAVVLCCRAPLYWKVTGELTDIKNPGRVCLALHRPLLASTLQKYLGWPKPGPHRFRPALALDKTLQTPKCKQQELGGAEAVLEQLGRNKESKAGTSVPKKMSAAGPRKAQNMTHFLKQSSATKENTENQRRRAN